MQDKPLSNPLDRLRLFKDSIRAVAHRIDDKGRETSSAVELEDKLGVALKLIRAFELGSAGQVSSCLSRFPELAQHIKNPYGFNCNSTRALLGKP